MKIGDKIKITMESGQDEPWEYEVTVEEIDQNGIREYGLKFIQSGKLAQGSFPFKDMIGFTK